MILLSVPVAIKKHFGVDDDAPGIVVPEGEEFIWPGYDLRKIAKTNSYELGLLLPPRSFQKVVAAFRAC